MIDNLLSPTFALTYLLPATVILWISWVLVTALAYRYGKDTRKPLVKLMFALFLLLDVTYNVVFASLLFLQRPNLKRLTLTARLRYILLSGTVGEDTWRFKWAQIICKSMISPRDYNHCGLQYGNKSRDL